MFMMKKNKKTFFHLIFPVAKSSQINLQSPKHFSYKNKTTCCLIQSIRDGAVDFVEWVSSSNVICRSLNFIENARTFDKSK